MMPHMGGGKPYIIVKLQTKSPIEIGHFVAGFTSVASQYDKFIKERYPDLAAEADIYVKQVTRGSIVVDLLPFVPYGVFGTELLTRITHINAVDEFIRSYKDKVGAYFKKNGRHEGADRSDLKDFYGTIAAIANDSDGKATIEAAIVEDGKKKVKTAFKFSTREAARAADQIVAHQRQLERRTHADFERVLMVFTQANIKDTPVGRKTNERVMIEQISDRDLPLVYASALAEQRIKHEIQEADENVFKKGFIVDVNVETHGGRPADYRLTNLHQVIDLPGESEP